MEKQVKEMANTVVREDLLIDVADIVKYYLRVEESGVLSSSSNYGTNRKRGERIAESLGYYEDFYDRCPRSLDDLKNEFGEKHWEAFLLEEYGEWESRYANTDTDFVRELQVRDKFMRFLVDECDVDDDQLYEEDYVERYFAISADTASYLRGHWGIYELGNMHIMAFNSGYLQDDDRIRHLARWRLEREQPHFHVRYLALDRAIRALRGITRDSQYLALVGAKKEEQDE